MANLITALPYDPATLGAIAVAALCLISAARLRQALGLRVWLIVLAAFVIRLDASRQASLHIWDESVHALVAKNSMSHPLTPTLYEHPLGEAPLNDWTETRVWLHKPPLALWLMAASMAMFGVSALAMRLPGLLLSTLSVALTYFTGRRLFDARIGLLAAGFQAVNGLLVSIASGRRVADHVDTALLACVQLAVFVVVRSLGQRSDWRVAGVAGLAMGAGVLAKSLPAATIAVVAFTAWLTTDGPAVAARRLLPVLAVAAIVAGPWLIYTHVAFPAEARIADAYTLRHITQVVEGHGGSIWSYVTAMPGYFGELVFVPVVWLLARALRSGSTPADRIVAVWIATPYVVFSLMATKLPGFIAIATPALFLAQAAFWCALRDRLAHLSGRGIRGLAIALLALLAILPARYLLAPTSALERRDRLPPATKQFMKLDRDLALPDAVIFHVPRRFELMFYSRYTAYDRLPRPEDLAELARRGIPFFVYQPAGEHLDVPSDWRVIEEPVR